MHRPFASLLVAATLAACGSPEVATGHLARLEGQPGPCSLGPDGIDVSEFNGQVDWGAVADGGLAFAFAKATEGLTIRDARFSENWSGMRASGLARGAYHFFHPGDDGVAQADAFLAAMGDIQPGDLPPVLDWETSDQSSAADAVAAAEAFIAEVESRSGRTTMVYTYRAYWDSIGAPAAFSASPLWLASDGPSCPSAPPPWSGWFFWQDAATGKVAGVNGPVDHDRFEGTIDDLRALARVPASQTTPSEPPLQARTGCGGEPACVWPACALAVAGASRHRRRAAASTPP
jgi:lysozyme